MPELFDMNLRAMRRDRAARSGAELFLLERAFDDCLERIQMMRPRFAHALLIGCPDPAWRDRIQAIASKLDVRDPGQAFASNARARTIVEDAWQPAAGVYDLVLAVGTLDTVNDLPIALRLIRHGMAPEGLFIGAMWGGDTLPRLRAAMRAADALAGGAAPHVHPRIEPSALSPLLDGAGFVRPVVDIDRVQASYRSLAHLVRDLRAMAATNVLRTRPPALTRGQAHAAAHAFAGAGDGERTIETFEIIHFAAWAPPR